MLAACLSALVVLQAAQFAAGTAGLDPSPPPAVLPLVAATGAIGVAARALVLAGERVGVWVGLGFCGLCLIGMGPHKLLTADGVTIAPVALVGFAAEVVFVAAAVGSLRRSARGAVA